MKFSAGYLLGAGTAIGLVASFTAGALGVIYGITWLDEQKDSQLEKAKNVSSVNFVSDFIRKGRN